MGIIYFDICAIPLFAIILFVCFHRKMVKGNANRLFLLVVLISFFCTLADLGMEVTDNAAPLTPAGVVLCNASTYIYFILRNANMPILLLYLLALTRTTFLIRKKRMQFLFACPYVCLVLILVQNPFTHNVFTVTANDGYNRGPLLLIFYGIALLYGIVGLSYCIYCKRYLTFEKWGALLSLYLLAHIAVMIQFFYPDLLLEMFFTAVSELLILISIMRPEERMDQEVGMQSWVSYQTDLRNIILTGERVQIIVIKIQNAREIRNYMGDHGYNAYLAAITGKIRALRWKHPHGIELYLECPGTIYVIAGADENVAAEIGELLTSQTGDELKFYEDMGVRFEPLTCLIHCPEDLKNVHDIISLGHKFHKIGDRKKTFFTAEEIVSSKNFVVEAHMEEILEHAIKQNHVEMYYQPIYDVSTGRFHSAEALARIMDPEYGMISPAVFIPAAEAQGFIIPIGDIVLDQVFRFISQHDREELGLSYIEINLSVAQCMEKSLPDKIRTLQQKYNVDPSKVNLEITETMFENINEIMVENVDKLIKMGYSFSLDDYGTGYSNIQRVNHIPIKIVKIDKSMIDETATGNGKIILEHTVRMMKSIGKELVAEGVESKNDATMLKELCCDYIQGFYYSRPLSATEFVSFLRQQNKIQS